MSEVSLDQLKKALYTIKTLKAQIKEQEENRDIAIIGTACQFPENIRTNHDFWDILKEGKNTTGEIPQERWDVEKYYSQTTKAGKMYTKYGSFMEDIYSFSPDFFCIPEEEAILIAPEHRILLEITYSAIKNANILSSIQEKTTGIYLGVNKSDYNSVLRENGYDNLSFKNILSPTVIAHIAHFFKTKGPSITIDTACASSLTALHLACQAIKNNECDMAIVGAINLMLTPTVYINLCQQQTLSRKNCTQIFDKNADGYIRGEGCGVVILRKVKDAIADQNNICAIVKGSALNHNSGQAGFLMPDKSSQKEVMLEALSRSKVPIKDIGYVEMHAIGTIIGDAMEWNSINEIFAASEKDIFVGSVKNNLGHLEMAAGIASLQKAILMLEHEMIPPHQDVTVMNPYIEEGKAKFTTKVIPLDNEKKNIMVNSFSYNGSNASVILEKYQAPQNTLEKTDVSAREDFSFLSYTGPRKKYFPEKLQKSKPVEVTDNFLEYEAPTNFQERSISQAFSQIFKKEKVSRKDNFFDLGGTSLLISPLFEKIQEISGKEIPPAAIFENPTIEQLALYMEQECSQTIITLQEYKDTPYPPIFLVHSVEGNGLNYYSLSQKLPRNVSIYLINAPQQNNEFVCFSSLEERANFYCQEMLSKYPSREYILGGHSAGGLIAYEMSRNLQQRNIQVPLLFLFDTLCHSRSRSIRYFANIGNCLHFWYYLPHWMYNKLHKETSSFENWVKILAPKVQKFVENNILDYSKYIATSHYYENGKIILFRAQRKSTHPLQRVPYDLGWHKQAKTKIEIHQELGTHREILNYQYVAPIAEKILKYLEQLKNTNK